MDRNKILITTLALIGLLFVGLILVLTNKSSLNALNQTRNFKAIPTQVPPDGVYSLLQPETVTTAPNQEFAVKLNYNNLKKPLQGADLILTYDPEILEFVRVQNTSAKFLNPRALQDKEKNRLIISFVEKADQPEPVEPELTMAELVFMVKVAGQTTLSPILNQENDSSMAIIKGSSINKLVSINPVTITTK